MQPPLPYHHLHTHFQRKYPNHTDDKPQEKTRSLSLSLSINTIPSLKIPFYYSLTKQRLSGWESRLLGLSCRKNSNRERERERERDGKHIVCVLWVRRASERRSGGEVGPVREIGWAWPSLLQPSRRSMLRRLSLHQNFLSRCQNRDQNQGLTEISIFFFLVLEF